MTTTIVTWNNETLTEELATAINSQATQMAADGKTDDNPIRESTETTSTAIRTWNTMADAEEWIAFVEQYTPMSATIQT
jgi:hypothetical protein